MKKALFKKEFKNFYIDVVTRMVNIIYDADPVSEEDSRYIIEAMKEIAIQKSALGEIYNNIVKEHPSIGESISRDEFVDSIGYYIQNGIIESIENFDI